MSELFDIPSDPSEVKPSTPDDQIRLVRLMTGEDILCVMRENLEDGVVRSPTDSIILSTPLKLIMHRVTPLRPASAIAIGITQWLPDELLECHQVSVKIGHIMTIMEPKDELKAYYKKTVDIIHTNMMIGDKTIRADITKASFDAGKPAEPGAPTSNTSIDALAAARMKEIAQQIREIDDYLMSYEGDDDEPITFH